MSRSPETSQGFRAAAYNHDIKINERLLTEKVGQPGAKIAIQMLDVLGLPWGQWSSADCVDRTNLPNDRIVAERITNETGVIVENGGDSLIFRDPRYFLNLDQELLDSMDRRTALILENEYAHYEAKKGNTDEYKALMSFAYLRLPGGVDYVSKGDRHYADWRKEHGKYLIETEVVGLECIREILTME